MRALVKNRNNRSCFWHKHLFLVFNDWPSLNLLATRHLLISCMCTHTHIIYTQSSSQWLKLPCCTTVSVQHDHFLPRRERGIPVTSLPFPSSTFMHEDRTLNTNQLSQTLSTCCRVSSTCCRVCSHDSEICFIFLVRAHCSSKNPVMLWTSCWPIFF